MTVLLSESSLVSEPRRLPSRELGLDDTRADGTLACALALKSTFSLTATQRTHSNDERSERADKVQGASSRERMSLCEWGPRTDFDVAATSLVLRCVLGQWNLGRRHYLHLLIN